MFEDTYAHFERDDVVAEYASFEFLFPPEQSVVAEFRPWLEGARILDMGVGAGRTAAHLAPLAAEYVGTDVSEPMVRACRERFHSLPGTSFRVLDARDMAPLDDASFDFVLFSFNGLDIVGDEADRARVLEEMRRLCRPGGLICFSSHNLGYALASFSFSRAVRLGLRIGGQRVGWRRRLRNVRRAVNLARSWRRMNPDHRRLSSADQAWIAEERPRFECMAGYYQDPRERILVRKRYVRPSAQVRRLRSMGFEEVRVFAMDGGEVSADDLALREHWWLYYVARRPAESGTAEPIARFSERGDPDGPGVS